MTYHTPRTWVTGETVTAEQMNEQIKDNLNELWKYQAAGDLMYATSGSTTTRTPIGSNGQVLTVSGGVPAWKGLITARKGGNSTHWNVPGTTTYTPTSYQIQVGSVVVPVLATYTGGLASVTFPVAFAGEPLVFLTVDNTTVMEISGHEVSHVTTTGFDATVYRNNAVGSYEINTNWLAIGPV